VNDEIEQLRERLEDIIDDWEDKLGTVPDHQRGLLAFVEDLAKQWRQCRRESIRGEGFQVQDRRIEHGSRRDRGGMRRGLLDKFKRVLERIPDIFDFGWMMFDRYIDIVADRMARQNR